MSIPCHAQSLAVNSPRSQLPTPWFQPKVPSSPLAVGTQQVNPGFDFQGEWENYLHYST